MGTGMELASARPVGHAGQDHPNKHAHNCRCLLVSLSTLMLLLRILTLYNDIHMLILERRFPPSALGRLSRKQSVLVQKKPVGMARGGEYSLTKKLQ
jgi:hypothetical protein